MEIAWSWQGVGREMAGRWQGDEMEMAGRWQGDEMEMAGRWQGDGRVGPHLGSSSRRRSAALISPERSMKRCTAPLAGQITWLGFGLGLGSCWR